MRAPIQQGEGEQSESLSLHESLQRRVSDYHRSELFAKDPPLVASSRPLRSHRRPRVVSRLPRQKVSTQLLPTVRVASCRRVSGLAACSYRGAWSGFFDTVRRKGAVGTEWGQSSLQLAGIQTTRSSSPSKMVASGDQMRASLRLEAPAHAKPLLEP